jgi:hypothetical protein
VEAHLVLHAQPDPHMKLSSLPCGMTHANAYLNKLGWTRPCLANTTTCERNHQHHLVHITELALKPRSALRLFHVHL